MLFSKACGYGLRAMLYLALQDTKRPVQVKQIADALHIPLPFLSNIIHTLSRHNLIQSHKGPGGGVTLAHPPAQMTLLQVVEVIDGLDIFSSCAMGIPHCSDNFPCPMHEQWGAIRHHIYTILTDRTLSQMISQFKDHDWVLTREK